MACRFFSTLGLNKLYHLTRSEFAARMDKEGGHKTDGGPKHLMDKEAAARIQSAEAKIHDGKVEKGGHASRAQSTADKCENQKN